ncbi:GFA family protein [Nocardia tengchongensis]|uniref:GFA family protein n=1 Tax=Nocardia tengchongensis TaxID=2055889 RepID=UPI0036D0E547
MYEGGCLCGKIRFRADAEAIWPHLCSCEHCQKLSGAPVVAWVSFPAASFTWTGQPKWFATHPTTDRGFCGECGSFLGARDTEGECKDQIGVTMFALDDHRGLSPVHQSCKDNAVPWLPVLEFVEP